MYIAFFTFKYIYLLVFFVMALRSYLTSFCLMEGYNHVFIIILPVEIAFLFINYVFVNKRGSSVVIGIGYLSLTTLRVLISLSIKLYNIPDNHVPKALMTFF